MTQINRDEWLAAVKAANEAPLPETDTVTIVEFADLIGMERAQASKRMRGLVTTGLAQRAPKKLVRRADGGIIAVPAYRLVKVAKSKVSAKRGR